MHPQPRTASLIAAATATMKRVNQDACALARNSAADLCAIITADGLGSHFRAEVGAQVVATSIRHRLEELDSVEKLDIPNIFLEARQRLQSHVEGMTDELPPDLDWGNAFGTTALCAVEEADKITLAYLGNGAILHLRGDFNTFPPNQLLPWTALNYLNPHSVPYHGKNLLYKLLSPRATVNQITPTVLTISKDDDRCGDIIVACSDGIYSYDQTPIGKDGEGHVWISGDETLVLLFAALSTFFAGGILREEELERCLAQYLDQVREKSLMTDDCTVAILVTGKAVEYQRALRKRETVEVGG